MTAQLQKLTSFDLGLLEYGRCLEFQEQLLSACANEKCGPTVLFVEHPPVVTVGKNADTSSLLVTEQELAQKSISMFRTERGGDITAHEPGQLVMYPILPLTKMRLSPRQYVHALEEAVKNTLKKFGVNGDRDEKYPGIWVGGAKVCAVGVRIKKRVSMHGIALNVCNNLESFRWIVPCGIRGRSITSITDLTNKSVNTQEVTNILRVEFALALGVQCVHGGGVSDLQTLLENNMIGA